MTSHREYWLQRNFPVSVLGFWLKDLEASGDLKTKTDANDEKKILPETIFAVEDFLGKACQPLKFACDTWKTERGVPRLGRLFFSFFVGDKADVMIDEGASKLNIFCFLSSIDVETLRRDGRI